jgi:cell division protein FtsQ
MGASEAASTPTQELARPHVDPRMRERWIAARRAEGRKRLKALIAVLVAMFLALGAFGVTRSPLLAVQHVEVTGAVHTTRDAVLAATGLGRRPQMLDLDLGGMRRQVTALPWVESASVTRHWPTSVVVQLVEREPLAVVPDGHGQPMLVDGAGRVLDPAGPDQTLPVIQGLPPAAGPGSFVDDAGRAALQIARVIPAALPAGGPVKLQAIQVAPDGSVAAALAPNITVVFGTADNLNAKLLALSTLLERVEPSTVATIDVRVADSPILTHAGQGSTVPTTPRG